jgi:hypothetical protein
VLDRASTFAHPDIIKMLKSSFVPVAIDQAYQRRQKDSEGELYRKIAGQGPQNDFSGGTTQGFYAASSSGELLFYNNNRNPDRVAGLMKQALAKDSSASKKSAPIADDETPDKRFNPTPPEGGLVLRVRAKVLGGYQEDAAFDPSTQIFQSSLSRDNLWLTRAEHEALVGGEFPVKLGQRIARYHLVDNTRGEPPMWSPEEIQSLNIRVEKGELRGSVTLETADGKRAFKTDLFGVVETKEGRVTRLDFVAKGLFRGHGPYTKNPPPGDFPLGISFSLADGDDVADAIPPQGSRGWVDGYFR